MAAWYLPILWLHITSVIASGTLYVARGCMLLARQPVANHWIVRRVATVIDTLLLAAAIALCGILGQYPIMQSWLTVKVALLVVYIVLGALSFRPRYARSTRIACLVGAVLVYLFIASVARTESPWGALLYLREWAG